MAIFFFYNSFKPITSSATTDRVVPVIVTRDSVGKCVDACQCNACNLSGSVTAFVWSENETVMHRNDNDRSQ